MRNAILTVLFAWLFGISASGEARAQNPAGGSSRGEGRLVIVGGGLRSAAEPVYRAILAGRAGSGPICIIPTASANIEGALAGGIAAIERWGGAGAAAGIDISRALPAAADSDVVAAQIRKCSGFYFSGGVQSRIVTVFRPDGRNTAAYEALIERFREGAVVAGSSAGAAIMSDPMIAGGSTTRALALGLTSAAGADADSERGVVIERGLGFLSDAVVDQHFLARGRFGRLIAAVLDLEEFDLGFGIDENTAIVVDGDSVAIAGASGVVVIDERGATRSGRDALDVALHLMSAGDHFDRSTGRLEIDPGKTILPPVPGSATVPENAFARWAFLHLLHDFAVSSDERITLGLGDGVVITMRKTAGFSVRATGAEGVRGTPAGLSITGLHLDVRREVPGNPPSERNPEKDLRRHSAAARVRQFHGLNR